MAEIDRKIHLGDKEARPGSGIAARNGRVDRRCVCPRIPNPRSTAQSRRQPFPPTCSVPTPGIVWQSVGTPIHWRSEGGQLATDVRCIVTSILNPDQESSVMHVVENTAVGSSRWGSALIGGAALGRFWPQHALARRGHRPDRHLCHGHRAAGRPSWRPSTSSIS